MPAQSRREQRHNATREEIKTMVRALMARHGTAGVSLREVAHEMGISPSALYYYFPNRDALITALILDAYDSLAHALEVARDQAEGTAPQLLAATLAYRDWAKEHPLDFQLLFGTPIPGYEAPLESTVPAATRIFFVLVDIFTTALEQGWSPTDAYGTVPEVLQAWISEVARQMEQNERSLPPLALYLAVSLLSHMHGTVMLDLSDHIPSIVGDVSAFYHVQMRTMLTTMGLVFT